LLTVVRYSSGVGGGVCGRGRLLFVVMLVAGLVVCVCVYRGAGC